MPLSNSRLWLQALTVGLLVALAVGMVYVLLAVYTGNDAAVASRSLLVECIIPPAEREPPVAPKDTKPDDCYLRTRTDQAQLLGEPAGPINTVAVAAAACGARYPGDVPATERCVLEALGEE